MICPLTNRVCHSVHCPDNCDVHRKQEHPMLFSDQMSRAVLAGRKTQTRRVITPQPHASQCAGQTMWGHDGLAGAFGEHVFGRCFVGMMKCPFGRVGDLIWVRERFAIGQIVEGRCAGNSFVHFYDGGQKYRDGAYYDPRNRHQWTPAKLKWKPSIHMPRWAARTMLEITGIRVERLQEISEADAIAEGCRWVGTNHGREFYSWWSPSPGTKVDVFEPSGSQTARDAFITLWNSINKTKWPWVNNPWVWAIEFKRITP